MSQGKSLRRRLLVAALSAALGLAALAADAGARTAYVVNLNGESVSVFDTATNQPVGAAIGVGKFPFGIAITPDGKIAYVASQGPGSVSVIDTATNEAVPPAIPVGTSPIAVAITPDGKKAYVANFGSGSVSAIDTATNEAAPAITVGTSPVAIAITPNSKTAYVVNSASKSVSVIDTATNEAAPLPIEVGTTPIAIAITPDGKTAYVVNEASKSVSVIDTATNAVASVPLGAGEVPAAIAITPDGRTAYVANEGSDNVSVIDTATNHVASTAIAVGVGPGGMAITADGHSAYVANNGANSVSVIDTATNVAPAATIPVGKGPVAIAIIPDQAPVASFSSPHEARLGAPVSFDASASKDPDGSIAGFVWDFGDGTKASTAGPAFSHAFARPGTFKVTLTATDNEGCPNKLIFTGQTSSCNGPVSPPEAPAVKVVYPTVRLTCPRSAKPRGCGFTLQAVTKKRRGKAETRVTRVKVKAGKSVQAPLKPQPKFVTKLGVAKRVLVKETLTVGGSRRTSFKQLRLR